MQLSPLNIKLKIDTLTCHGTGRKQVDRPYLWNIFFKADGNSVKIQDNFRLAGEVAMKYSQGSHNNLSQGKIMSGDLLYIPPNVGEWNTQLTPMILPYFHKKVPGVVGVLSVLMEKNSLSSSGAEAGHQFLNTFVRDAVNQALMDFDPKKIDLDNLEESVKVFFERRVLHYTDGLEGKMAREIIKSQNLFQNILSLLDKDVMIGFEIVNFSHDQIESAEKALPVKILMGSEELGAWELQGELTKLSTH